MSILEYKGYQAKAEYEDGSMIIKVLHIKDSLLATCDSAQDVEIIFHELIDEYIANCEVLGREANKPFKGSFNVRIDPNLHKKAAYEANRKNVTLNAFVAQAIEEITLPKSSTVSARYGLDVMKFLKESLYWKTSSYEAPQGMATQNSPVQEKKSKKDIFRDIGQTQQGEKWAFQ